MSLTACIFLGSLASWIVGVLAWAHFGPFAGSLVTMGAFFMGSIWTAVWLNQGRTL